MSKIREYKVKSRKDGGQESFYVSSIFASSWSEAQKKFSSLVKYWYSEKSSDFAIELLESLPDSVSEIRDDNVVYYIGREV